MAVVKRLFQARSIPLALVLGAVFYCSEVSRIFFFAHSEELSLILDFTLYRS